MAAISTPREAMTAVSTPRLAVHSPRGALGFAAPRGPGQSSLKLAGIDLTSKTSFDRLHGENCISNRSSHVPVAGKSINDYADTAAIALQPDVYCPAMTIDGFESKKPPLPSKPAGDPSAHGPVDTVLKTFKAGQKFGIEEYKNAHKETIYASTTREPLGKSYVRGHVLPHETTRPQGFGRLCEVSEDVKQVIFPRNGEPEKASDVENYIKTHGAFRPGETVNRDYAWPKAVTANEHFRFGLVDDVDTSNKGQGVKDALTMEREAGGAHPLTRVVQRTAEDYRHVASDHLGRGRHLGQGSPPVAPGYAFGVQRLNEEWSAGALIRGDYSLEEQMPDHDLGRCTRVGHRNVPTVRSLGCSSVRRDIAPVPFERRSLADPRNYGDEKDAGSLIRPQRFELLGVPDSEFVARRPRDEIASILAAAGYQIEDGDFATVWQAAVHHFGDGEDSASLEAVMNIYAELRGQR